MTKICSNCGTSNKDTSKFCANCGAEIKIEKNTISNSKGVSNWWKSQNNGVKGITIIGICCLGLFLIIGIFGMITPDASDTTSTPTPTVSDVNSSDSADSSSEPVETTTTDEYSGLNNPQQVKDSIAIYDANGDGKIEFVDSKSDDPDGQEEYAAWATYAGYDSSDSYTLVQLFNAYDSNGDLYWDKYDLDDFWDDYNENN